jgi:hypothetical protein
MSDLACELELRGLNLPTKSVRNEIAKLVDELDAPEQQERLGNFLLSGIVELLKKTRN